mgnify:CR=1 FL=1
MIGGVGPALRLNGEGTVGHRQPASVINLDTCFGRGHCHFHTTGACEGDNVAQVLSTCGGAEVVVENVGTAGDFWSVA